MYKILLVDDEAVVREGIRDNMDWARMGFELVGVCADGREAMAAVDALRPDVVLTDIYMPFVDGLELTRYIAERYSRTKIVILTGYDEFEYAQQAVKLKASDYLLKPITAGELRQVLDKVKNDLDEEAGRMEDLKNLKMQLKESLPLLKERFLNRLVSGKLREGELARKPAYFNLELKGDCFIVLVVDIDDYGELGKYHPGTEDELLLFAVYNISEELTAKDGPGIVFQSRSDRTVIILTGDKPEDLCERALKLSEGIRAAIEKYLRFTVTIGIGIIGNSLSVVHRSYKSAVSALDYRFILGKNRVINISDMEQNPSRGYASKKQWDKTLAYFVKVGSSGEAEETIRDMIAEMKSRVLPVERCYIHIQQVLTAIIQALDELGTEENEVFGNTNPFTEIYNYKTLSEIEIWLKDLCKKVMGHIAGRRSDFSKIQVLQAEEYIKENYGNEDISLNTLCKHLFISTSYFSLIFKQNTGETFVEYLTRVRVEKAKELLKTTSLKTYEISNSVGYSDPHYFSLIFKKATGLTPTDYREKTVKENAD